MIDLLGYFGFVLGFLPSVVVAILLKQGGHLFCLLCFVGPRELAESFF